jgi:hypothetical protein
MTTDFQLDPPRSLQIPARQPTRARFWTGDVEWYTPPFLLAAAAEVMGDIDLDPASSDAQQIASPVKASRYFTVDDDGLAQPWCGRIFLNPPYAARIIDQFVTKLLAEYRVGNVQQALLLTNASTETRWWQSAARQCGAVCLLRGRVRFLKLVNGMLTPGTSSPSHPHSVFYFGDATARFAQMFARHGLVFPQPFKAAIAERPLVPPTGETYVNAST